MKLLISFRKGRNLFPVILGLYIFTSFPVFSQKDSTHSSRFQPDHWSIAFTNNHTAYPFASFSALVTGEWHPGFELGTGFNWSKRKKHDWYQELKLGYFNHQFVQHGIPLYTNFGYRYKFSKHFTAQAGIGAGMLLSIPDHKRYKLDSEGNYEAHNKVRLQGMFVFNLNGGYRFALEKQHPMEIFITYQQRIQTPYVPSYVPLLPYNSLMLGVKRGIKGK
jgi:hypothetical protein